MRTLVIIPTYNEKDNIFFVLQKIILLYHEAIDVLVVDDNSPDGTAEQVATLQHSYSSIFLLKRVGKIGLASAYIDGFTYAIEHDYDVVIQMDADLSHDPLYIKNFLEQITHHDVVVGSRYMKGGGVKAWSLFRRVLSFLGNFYAQIILGMSTRDLTGGYNCWRMNTLKNMGLRNIRSQGYSFQIELKYKAHISNASLFEIPIIFSDRTSGKSKFSKYIFFEAMWRVWWMRLFIGR